MSHVTTCPIENEMLFASSPKCSETECFLVAICNAMQPTKNDELELFAIRCDDVIDALIFIPHRLWIMAHLNVYVCA